MPDDFRIGIVGSFQNGKSTFINCLLDGVYARTGSGLRTTALNTAYRYGEIENVQYFDKQGKVIHESDISTFLSGKEKLPHVEYVEVTAWKPVLRHLTFVDTPGINANDKDNDSVSDILHFLDAAIFILHNKGVSQAEVKLMKDLTLHGIPFYVVMNCHKTGSNILSWAPTSKQNIRVLENLKNQLSAGGLSPLPLEGNSVLPINLHWFWYASGKYILEEAAHQETLLEDIEFYTAKKTKGKTALTRDIFAKESGFMSLRQFFCNAYAHHLTSHLKTIRRLNESILSINTTIQKHK